MGKNPSGSSASAVLVPRNWGIKADRPFRHAWRKVPALVRPFWRIKDDPDPRPAIC